MTREEVWLRAWCSTANAIDCKRTQTATTYADVCLAEFDKRFPAPKKEYTPFQPRRKP